MRALESKMMLCESCDESCDPLANGNESYNVKMLKELVLKANLELIDKNAQIEKLQQQVNTLENKLKGVENSNLSEDLELKKAHPWASKFIRPSNYKTTVDFEKMNQGQGPHDKTGLGFKEDEEQQKEEPKIAQAKGKGPNHAYKYHPRYTNNRNRRFNGKNFHYNYNQVHRTYQPKFYDNGHQRYMRDSRGQQGFYPRQRTPHHYRPRPQRQEGTMAEEKNSSTTCRNCTITQAQGGTMDSPIDSKNLLNHPVSQRTFLHKGQPTFVHFATK